jgi:hypothetical protein
MSVQSNYIDYLRDSTILKEQSKLQPVLNMSDYIKFKNFTLINTIPNSKNKFSELFLNNKKNIYGMERNTSNCVNFQLCNSTDKRTNRKLKTAQLPMMTFQMEKKPLELCNISNPNSCNSCNNCNAPN